LGIYFNPGNEGFRESTADPIYVDKSGIIPLLNPRIKSKRQKYLCVTRSRRFGKTCTAEMLAAYYKGLRFTRPFWKSGGFTRFVLGKTSECL